ncbi:hypothetical protein [Sphingomonas koreensis]|uniref:hypothetical protein n=1 Tax=Sphingomonas koreensis TaxID=93064 RepID=UPI000A6712BD|nr:hypothetical protein [Sphingomonas koreensis]
MRAGPCPVIGIKLSGTLMLPSRDWTLPNRVHARGAQTTPARATRARKAIEACFSPALGHGLSHQRLPRNFLILKIFLFSLEILHFV